jgi:hypothetical protein
MSLLAHHWCLLRTPTEPSPTLRRSNYATPRGLMMATSPSTFGIPVHMTVLIYSANLFLAVDYPHAAPNSKGRTATRAPEA